MPLTLVPCVSYRAARGGAGGRDADQTAWMLVRGALRMPLEGHAELALGAAAVRPDADPRPG